MRYGDWAGAERRLLAALRRCGRRAPVATAARALSFTGEHGALWLAAGVTGAAVDPERRTGWLRGTALIAAAHLASMGVKRVVRRPRPGTAEYEPLVRTAGRHSFPSSHATSAAAAVVVFGALHPAVRRLAAPAATAMCVSRLVVGVHYPTDVAAGALLGAATAALGRGWLRATPYAPGAPHATPGASAKPHTTPGASAKPHTTPGASAMPRARAAALRHARVASGPARLRSRDLAFLAGGRRG